MFKEYTAEELSKMKENPKVIEYVKDKAGIDDIEMVKRIIELNPTGMVITYFSPKLQDSDEITPEMVDDFTKRQYEGRKVFGEAPSFNEKSRLTHICLDGPVSEFGTSVLPDVIRAYDTFLEEHKDYSDIPFWAYWLITMETPKYRQMSIDHMLEKKEEIDKIFTNSSYG